MVKVTREPGCLRFDWPLQREVGWILIGFGTLIGAAAIAITLTPRFPPPESWSDQYTPLLIIGAFALLAVYSGLYHLVNRIQLIVTAQNVVRTGGPLPPNRSQELAAPDVVQFFAMQVSSARNSGSYSFNCVYALDRDHQVWLVAKNLPSGFAASQICHELEDFYGIEDMEVYGVTTDPSHPGPRK